jgi:APA family basic amino acid/polyamine antiporter
MILIISIGIFIGFDFDCFKSNISLSNNAFPQGFEFFKILSIAIVGSMFASITWNNVTFIASEIKNPVRNIPLALFWGTILVIFLYISINIIYVGVMPISIIQNSHQDIVAAELINTIFGHESMIFISIIIAISAFGCANGMILTGSRVYYKMAKDGLFLRPLAQINRKTKVPEKSLWLQCFWICILILWGSYSQLLEYVIYSSLIFYAITIWGIFKIRRLYPQKNDVAKVHNIFIFIFMIMSTFIIVGLTFYKPQYTLPGFIISLAGIPVYNFYKKYNKKL